MKALFLKFITVLSIFSVCAANAQEMEYQKYVKTREDFWNWADSKVRQGDKVICAPEERTNMSTCVRAYILLQPISAASEILRVQKIISSAAEMDSKAQAMDEATILIYATESILKFRESLNYKNPFCPKESFACEKEKKVFAEVFPYLIKKIRDNLTEIKKLRRKYPAQGETEEWRASRVDYIDSNYRALMVAPGETAKISDAAIAQELRAERKAKTTAAAKGLIRDNPADLGCLKVQRTQMMAALSAAIEPCIAIDAESLTQECNRQKVAVIKNHYMKRMTAAEKKAVKKCVRKVKASKKRPS